ncbi:MULTISPECIES: hypothetical protein [unclassified Chryseobacterium]|uniref:hypothetical protein n=1 Tax=unclassified Chryseobacterium TaxID=2593645 RepID=UPI00100A844A|nr:MULTISPECIES: hypothetical protein [unclassified Chryseobacterium]RXM52940.1 hypothetical protein BOQ64_00555 [Chryseobacterium sp. CH25]RXM65862.1 hypothetical protein BOQ60_08950 [Chryseobacterium sp. CH1]
MERVEISKITVEELTELLKADSVKVSLEEAEMVLVFLYSIANLVIREKLNFEIIPQSLQKLPLRGSGLYLMEGKVVVDYDCPAIEVHRCAKMPLKPDPRSV